MPDRPAQRRAERNTVMSNPPLVTPARGLATFILIFASFMDLIDGTIVNVALPSIRDDLQATPAQLEWIVSAYLLAFAVVLVTGGRLGDIFGRQRIFIIGVAGFTVFSLAAAVAPSADLLVGARIAQGVCAALMAPQLLSSVQVLYAPRERGPIFGIVGAVSGLAAVVGPLLGGWLVTADLLGLGWRSIFVINVPVGLVIIAAAWRFVPNSTSTHPLKLDLPGVGLATACLFLITFSLVDGREQDWRGWIWGMLAAGLVLLAVFVRYQVVRERRDGSSLLPMHLFGNRGYSAGIVAQSVFQGSMVGFFLTLTIYLQTGLGFSAIDAGLTLVPFSVGAFIGTGVSVPLGVKLGKMIMFVGAVLQGVAISWVIQVIHANGPTLTGWHLAPALGLGGFGLGLLVVPLVDVALATVPPADAGAASGAYGTFQQCGAALGVAISGVVFFGVAGTTFTADRLADAITAAAWVSITGFALCALATTLLPPRSAVAAHAAAAAAATHATT
jgi:EmrB/QacA subfamily drug resistance transporter